MEDAAALESLGLAWDVIDAVRQIAVDNTAQILSLLASVEMRRGGLCN